MPVSWEAVVEAAIKSLKKRGCVERMPQMFAKSYPTTILFPNCNTCRWIYSQGVKQ